MRAMPRFVVLCLLALVADQGLARRAPDPCAERGNTTACYVAHQHDLLDIFGLTPAADHQSRGVQIRRAMFFGRSVNPIVAVEFRRSPGEEPIVSVFLPLEEESESAPATAVSAAVPEREWQRISQRSNLFDRVLVPLPTQGVTNGQESILICSDAGLDVVEATDPAAQFPGRPLRQRAEDTCENGLAVSFADELAEAALRLIPACAALDRRDIGDSPWILESCGRLRGDRMAAAQVSNTVQRFRWHAEDDLSAAFGDEGTLDWMGEESLRGREAARGWARHVTANENASLFPRSVYGETVDRVRWVGFLEKWTRGEHDNSILWRAPVEMIWVRQNGGGFGIDRVSVDAYRQLTARCDPGQLTGADGC